MKPLNILKVDLFVIMTLPSLKNTTQLLEAKKI